jgi:hypothetical protein
MRIDDSKYRGRGGVSTCPNGIASWVSYCWARQAMLRILPVVPRGQLAWRRLFVAIGRV